MGWGMVVRGVLSPLSGLISEIMIIQLVCSREILHLSGESQGKFREFQKPLVLATMIVSVVCLLCSHPILSAAQGAYRQPLNSTMGDYHRRLLVSPGL